MIIGSFVGVKNTGGIPATNISITTSFYERALLDLACNVARVSMKEIERVIAKPEENCVDQQLEFHQWST